MKRAIAGEGIQYSQGRIQDFVKGWGGGGCTLHGQNVIRETQHYDNSPKITFYIDNIFPPTRKEKGLWEKVCSHRPTFSTCFWGLRGGGCAP